MPYYSQIAFQLHTPNLYAAKWVRLECFQDDENRRAWSPLLLVRTCTTHGFVQSRDDSIFCYILNLIRPLYCDFFCRNTNAANDSCAPDWLP